MIDDDVLVIDATVHAFNFLPDNYRYDWLLDVVRGLSPAGSIGMFPGDPAYAMSFDEFVSNFEHQPELMIRALFAESRTDIGIYHGVPLEGIYHDGSSPTWVAAAIAERHPGRMFTYGPLYPWKPDALEELERQVVEDHVIGIKLYPVDLVDGELRPTRMDADDTAAAIERARQLGVRVIGIHKAVPLGPVLSGDQYFGVDDLAPVLAEFPDVTFEIVHGGRAFLEETAELYGSFPNTTINLEGPSVMALQAPEQFEILLGRFLAEGGHERILYATGSTAMHPEPVIHGMWTFQFSEGSPHHLTREMRADIMGANFARVHGWDIEALGAAIAGDRFGLVHDLDEPWSLLKAARAAS